MQRDSVAPDWALQFPSDRRGGVRRGLVSLGFAPLGELGIPERWAFKEPVRLAGTNTYVIVDGCLSLRNHRGLRAVLRADAALRDEYAAVKRLAGARAADIDEYGQLKGPVVQKILAAAGLTDAERASIASSNLPPTTSSLGRPGTSEARSLAGTRPLG